ncbi:MAG TPA: serine/threonine-protein kinase [Candidatus Deferrimicrobium sp.]|nr:serine/threonine-protein kinase [Candidatus Deferrimicrobium sp.]
MDKSFGKYTVTKKLGNGAMGVVYLGYDKTLDRPVAIKIISSTMREDEREPRFIREAQSTAKLRHNNIVTIYDFGVEGEQLYIVMEYLEGHDLDELISAQKPLDIKDRLEIVRQICLGLDYAHRNGVLHRDIKPGNVRVLEDDTIKIMDFGLAALNSAAATITQSDAILGTPHYIAPERVHGEKADARSDQFSAGLILYEILTYRRPFTGETISNIIFNILNTQPKRLDPEIISMFPEIEFIIKKSIAKNREHRYPSMKEMAAAIGALQQKMINRGFCMNNPIKVTDDLMGTLEDNNTETLMSADKYDEPTVELNPVKENVKRRNLKAALLLALPVLGLLAALYFFVLVPNPPAPAPGNVSVPVSTAANEGYLAFDVKPYAAIDEVVNLESQQPVLLTGESRTTPVRMGLQPGKYRIVYSHPQWKGKKRTKIITVLPGETICLEDCVEQNFILDAIKNLSAVKTKPASNASTLTATVGATDLSPAEKLIDSGKQLVMEGKLSEAREKFAAVLELESGHQAALHELNSLAVKYLDKGIGNYFNGETAKSEGLFREAVQTLSPDEVAEKYSKNLIIAYQFLAVVLIEKHYLGNDTTGKAVEEARSYIVRLFAINPGFQLEKKYFSPKVTNIFSQILEK